MIKKILSALLVGLLAFSPMGAASNLGGGIGIGRTVPDDDIPDTDDWTEAELEASLSDVSNVIIEAEIDTAAELDALVADENLIVETEIDTAAELDTIVADENLIVETEMDTEAELEALLTDMANIIQEAEIDAFSELQAIVADKTLVNEEDAVGDLTVSSGNWQVVDDSHAHVITNIDAFTEAELETQLSDVSDVIVSTEVDAFSELQALVADKTLVNEEDAVGDLTVSLGNWQVVDDSHAHVITDIDAFSESDLETQAGSIDLIVSTEIDDFSELQALVADKTLVNEEDAVGDLTVSSGNWQVVDDSHAHVITNIDSFSEAELETQLSDVSNVIVSTEIDAFSELQALVADKTLVNEEDAVTWDAAHIFSLAATGLVSFDLYDSGVTHPVTDLLATNVHFRVETATDDVGGARIIGITDADTASPFNMIGIIGVADPSDTRAAFSLRGEKSDGGTGRAALGADETVLRINNYGTAIAEFLGDGNTTIDTGDFTLDGTVDDQRLNVFLMAGEANQVYLEMWADEGDNAADKTRFVADDDPNELRLEVNNGGNTVWTADAATQKFTVSQDLQADDYFSGDGTQGITGGTCSAWKDGLCTSA